MNSIASKLGYALMVTFAAGATAAWAEDTCHGYSVGTSKDRVLIHVMGVVPMHLASGECGETSSGGQGKMTRDCTYTDRDGDRWTSTNNWEKGTPSGTWCNVNGTGKYEKTMGGCGWWKTVQTGPISAWEFGGQCQLMSIDR